MKNILLFLFCFFLSLSSSAQTTQDQAEVPEWVLIDGIKWATRNVDAPGTFTTNPEDLGMLYHWNGRIAWKDTDPTADFDCNPLWSRYNIDNIWEKINDPCPSGWRVPTGAELNSLASVAGERTAINDVNGRIFGNDDNLLFLPSAGYGGNNGTVYYMGSPEGPWGSWVSTTTSLNPRYQFHVNRFRVRCVAE
ncbi:MAG: hypothetical protein FWD09_02830 [Lentimicrobiaceae bacterium]|nr:hypothetical protein [Lentimicrobiaceae bacterium]